jgi:hypothetical protein
VKSIMSDSNLTARAEGLRIVPAIGAQDSQRTTAESGELERQQDRTRRLRVATYTSLATK